MRKIRRAQLEAAHLRRIPTVEPLDVAQVGQRQHPVQFAETRVVDSADAESVAARGILHEKHLDRIAHVRLHPVGHRTREQHFLMADRVAHVGQPAGDEAPPHRRPIVGRIDPFEHDPLHRLFATQDAAFHGIRVETLEAGDSAQIVRERLIAADGLRLIGRRVAVQTGDLHMGPETRQLGGYLALESEYDGQRDDHHRDADGDAQRGDPHHYVVSAAGRNGSYPLRQKVFEIQSAHRAVGFKVFGMQNAK